MHAFLPADSPPCVWRIYSRCLGLLSEPSNSSCGLHLDGWQYKMSFCRAVTQDEFEPGQCDGADGKNDVNSE